MPDLDGIEVTRQRRADASRTRASCVFTSFSDRDGILRALDAGAIGYLLKDAEPEEIHEAIRAAARGEAPLAPRPPPRCSPTGVSAAGGPWSSPPASARCSCS